MDWFCGSPSFRDNKNYMFVVFKCTPVCAVWPFNILYSVFFFHLAYNPNTFFLNWKQRTAGKAVEDALQYIKMYVAGVWTKTAKGYFKNVEEQVIRRQSKVWSNL